MFILKIFFIKYFGNPLYIRIINTLSQGIKLCYIYFFY